MKDAKLTFIKEKLRSLNYQLLEEDTITAKGLEAQRFIAQSSTGNLIAEHTNPPFPFTKHSRRQHLLGAGLIPKTSATAKLLAGLSVGSILLGAAVLLRSRRR
ncbi:MAG: hypothetical protein EOO63_02460 [Hymenobacter sp.]|nr:MAG: hypothetical protein EOO63_02460 [Hymenobacter sp.]